MGRLGLKQVRERPRAECPAGGAVQECAAILAELRVGVHGLMPALNTCRQGTTEYTETTERG